MNIDDFDISIKPLKHFLYECLIKHKNHPTKFGVVVQGNNTPSPVWVLNQLLTNKQAFFIEVEQVQDVGVVPTEPPIPSGSV
jgi:hypothetical protein